MSWGGIVAQRANPGSRNAGARADNAPGKPDFLGLRRTGGRFGSQSTVRPLGQPGIPSQRINEVSTVDISGAGGRGYAVSSFLAETALARKFLPRGELGRGPALARRPFVGARIEPPRRPARFDAIVTAPPNGR